MRDHDLPLYTLGTSRHDPCAIVIRHVEAVDHHQLLDRQLHA